MINLKKERTALHLIPKQTVQDKNVCISIEPRQTISKSIKNDSSKNLKELRENLWIYSTKMAEKKRSPQRLSSNAQVNGERRSCNLLSSKLKLDSVVDSTKFNFHFRFFKKPYRNTKREYFFPEAKKSFSTTDKLSQSTLHEENNEHSETTQTVLEETEFTYKEKESESVLFRGVESSQINKHADLRLDNKFEGTTIFPTANQTEQKKKEIRKSVKEIVEISQINEIEEKNNNGRKINYQLINKSKDDYLRSRGNDMCCSNSKCMVF